MPRRGCTSRWLPPFLFSYSSPLLSFSLSPSPSSSSSSSHSPYRWYDWWLDSTVNSLPPPASSSWALHSAGSAASSSSSSHPHILSSSHPHILSSSHPLILSSSHPLILSSSHPPSFISDPDTLLYWMSKSFSLHDKLARHDRKCCFTNHNRWVTQFSAAIYVLAPGLTCRACTVDPVVSSPVSGGVCT